MKIVALMENTSERPDCCTEHGLSLYLETCGHKILFDTGQSSAFDENADTLGVDLAAVDLAVLSHGHYDHGGGLGTFLTRNEKAPVYLSKHAFEEHLNADGKDIGLDRTLQANKRLVFVGDSVELAEGLELCSCNARSHPFGSESFGLSVRRNGVTEPDDFWHEQYLLITEGKKRVLIRMPL